MKKARQKYAMTLTIITLLSFLIAGTITAEKNTRRLTFGEEYKTVEVSDKLIDEIKDLFD